LSFIFPPFLAILVLIRLAPQTHDQIQIRALRHRAQGALRRQVIIVVIWPRPGWRWKVIVIRRYFCFNRTVGALYCIEKTCSASCFPLVPISFSLTFLDALETGGVSCRRYSTHENAARSFYLCSILTHSVMFLVSCVTFLAQ
jgi:hypothetical protein